jgi:hypothetical protein
MARNHILIALLLVLALLMLAPAVHAADIEDLTAEDILNALGPRSGDQLIWDILLYSIFISATVTMFLIPDKQLAATLCMFLVMFLALVSKVLVGNTSTSVIQPTDLPVLGFNAGMFVIPLIVAGIVRARRGTPKALLPSILTGILGGGYFFLYWALEQRDYVSPEDTAALIHRLLGL